MLGDILSRLTDPGRAEEALELVGRADLRDRIAAAAATEARPVPVLVAERVRHLLEHGGEDMWVDLLGAMSGSPQPGAAAVHRIMALAFPDPVRVRITRGGG